MAVRKSNRKRATAVTAAMALCGNDGHKARARHDREAKREAETERLNHLFRTAMFGQGDELEAIVSAIEIRLSREPKLRARLAAAIKPGKRGDRFLEARNAHVIRCIEMDLEYGHAATEAYKELAEASKQWPRANGERALTWTSIRDIYERRSRDEIKRNVLPYFFRKPTSK